jgi:tetratricopeptide (TPR) repeat protein
MARRIGSIGPRIRVRGEPFGLLLFESVSFREAGTPGGKGEPSETPLLCGWSLLLLSGSPSFTHPRVTAMTSGGSPFRLKTNQCPRQGDEERSESLGVLLRWDVALRSGWVEAPRPPDGPKSAGLWRTRRHAGLKSADAEGAHRFGELARGLAEELGDQELCARALSFLLGAENMDGDLDAAHEHALETLRIWQPNTRLDELATAQEWISLNDYWRGDYEAAEESSRQAYELGNEVHSIGPVVNGGAQLALSLSGLGRHEEALALFERVVAQGRELEAQPRFTSRAINMWAGALHEVFEIDEARAKNEEAIALGERAAFPGSQVSGKIDLLYSDLVLGDVGRAEESVPALQAAAEATKGWHQWLWITRLARAKAEVALAVARHEEALELAAEAIAMAERYHRLKYAATSRIVFGRALREAGRATEAVDALGQALAEADRLKHPPTIWSAAAALAAALYSAGNDAGAEDALARVGTEIGAFSAGLSEARREGSSAHRSSWTF